MDLTNEHNQEQAPVTQLKRIDFTKPSFMANGREYFIEGQMSITRFCEFQILEKEFAFKMSFKGMYEELLNLYEKLNELKMADAVIIVNNLLNGHAKMEEREPTVLKLCTLFINERNEDRSAWSADLMTQKIEDWKIEGISMEDFFTVALSTVNGYAQISSVMSERILEEQTLGTEAHETHEEKPNP